MYKTRIMIINIQDLTSGILFNIVGNFYAINNVKHKLKFGFGLEYRNITDAITIGVFNPLLKPMMKHYIQVLVLSNIMTQGFQEI